MKRALEFPFLTILFLTLVGISRCYSNEETSPNFMGELDRLEQSWTFTSYFENDLFARTDQNYTNGVKASWVSPDLTRYRESGRLPSWSLPLVKKLPFINRSGLQRNVAISIGQNMYTPEDIASFDLIETDRPYAGWLYFGVAFHNKNEFRLDSMEVQMGLIGPFSLAQESQKLVHETRGLQRPNGWHHQLKTEPGLALIYTRTWRWHTLGSPRGWGFDVIPHAGATVGNVYSFANAGLQARFGWKVPSDYGTSYIRPAGETNAPLAKDDPRLREHWGSGFHIFLATEGRLVARDIFLDGNTFTDSHRVDKKQAVADAAAGISLLLGRIKVSYAQIFRTREFSLQKDDHTFGSMSISFSY